MEGVSEVGFGQRSARATFVRKLSRSSSGAECTMLLYRGVTMLYGFSAWQAFSKSASYTAKHKGQKCLCCSDKSRAPFFLLDVHAAELQAM